MKLNWGAKIAVLYLAFVILIISMVGMAMRQKVDLVSKDYYEQELNYQDKIDKTYRTHTLKEPLTWQVKRGEVLLRFPTQFKGQTVKGSIYFFRPSDETMDKKINFTSIDTSLFFPVRTDNMKMGLYKIQIDWEAGNQKYYNESIIKIN